MTVGSISQRIQPGLWKVYRQSTKVVVWMAIANGITLMSYSEDYARLWLSRELDDPEPLDAA
jgi:hypothetical protein